MERESLQTEFKREFTEDFKYAVIAFANTDGGELYFGINDDGRACGISNVDDTMLRITNIVRDAIRPDVSLFTKCTLLSVEEKSVIRLTVQRGTAKPYYLKAKGIRPEGVYVRQGASSVPASEAAILQMIKEASCFVYEDSRALEQELTFDYAEKCFSERGVAFSAVQQRSLNLIGTDGMYTKLALLLSDQCPHIIKLAVFQGSTKTLFKDRREFSGSLLKQLDDAFAFLDLCNRTRAEIVGLERVDSRDYPGEALRETLLNLIVHRDYAVQSPALISIFDDRIEFVSVGGLMPEISYDDIMLGVSVARNPRLADVFYRLHLIEAYGTGILKINESYSGLSVQPKIEVSTHAFKVTLPNANFEAEQAYGKMLREKQLRLQESALAASYALSRTKHAAIFTAAGSAAGQPATPTAATHAGAAAGTAVSPATGAVFGTADTAFTTAPAVSGISRGTQSRKQALDALFTQKPVFTRRDVELALNTSQPNAVLILRRLVEEGTVQKIGSGKNVHYQVQ